MEAVTEVFTEIGKFLAALKINPMYVLLWVAAGYIQRIYLIGLTHIGKLQVNDVWRTFILGSFFSVVYAFLLRDYGQKNTWVEFAASYVFATSMYEMFLKDLVNKVITYAQKVFNKKLDA